MPPQLISGNINALDPNELKIILQEAGITRLDTAAHYMNGESEKVLGKARFPETFHIDTKIKLELPGDGSLSAKAIDRSLTNSLNVLVVEKVNVLYCHAPDFKTPVAEQARAFNEHYEKGRFSQVSITLDHSICSSLMDSSWACQTSQPLWSKNGSR